MPEWITSIVATLGKASPVFLMGMALAAGFILFADEKLVSSIYLSSMRVDYGTLFGLVFVISVSVLVAQGGRKIWVSIDSSRKRRKNSRLRQEMLHELTPDEKSCLGEYIIYEEATQYFAASDGVAQGLEAKKIIVRTSNLSTSGMTFPYSLQPWARRYLTLNRYLLD